MIPLTNRPLLVLYSPINTQSGYGGRGRDLAYSLIKLKEPEYDVRFISCNWGACAHGALDPENDKHKMILDRILPNNQLPKQPDVWIMHSVPNEMQRVGAHYNILVTAGVETHICTPEFLEGCNRADLVIVSSNFAKEVFQRSGYDKINQQTQQVESKLKLDKKIEVLFEGLDRSVYYNIDRDHEVIDGYDEFDYFENFCFLIVGHWLNGELFHDRKNIATTIKIFLETFKNQKKAPGLVLKVSGGSPSIIDREQILDKIDAVRKTVKAHQLPNIHLIYGELADYKMNQMYSDSKIKAMIHLGNEGFGRPLLEFSAHAKPIIASAYSGHLDFLNPEFVTLVPGQIQQIHPSVAQKSIIPAEGGWYYPDINEASNALKNVYENYNKFLVGAKRQAYRSITEFSMDKMTEKLKDILDANLPKLSIPITLKLPALTPRPVKIQSDEAIADS